MSPLNFSSSPGLGSPAPTSTLSRFAVPASSSTGLTGSGLSRFEPGSIQQPPSTHFNINEDGLTRYQQSRIDEKDRVREEAIAGGALTMDQAKELFLSGDEITDPNIFDHLGVPMEAFRMGARPIDLGSTPRGAFAVGDPSAGFISYLRPERFTGKRGHHSMGERFFAPTEWIPADALASGIDRNERKRRKHGAKWAFDSASWELSDGGLVMKPVVSYGLGGPVAAGVTDESRLGGQLSPDQEQLLQGAIAALDPASKMSEEDRMLILREFEEEFGPGSVKMLMEEIDGESGSGEASDGLSDSIPAVVDGVQPAALSEGEFVVPSDAVAGIGNGSSEAGARELMGMVDRIRGARGNAGKPKKINAGNLLVA